MANIVPRNHPLASGTDDSAIDRVLAVPELLEAILEYLPFLYGEFYHTLYRSSLEDIDGIASFSQPQALFAVQRVNRMFKNTISGSLILRRLMFLAPQGRYFVYPDVDPENWDIMHYQRSPLFWLGEQGDPLDANHIIGAKPCDEYPEPACRFEASTYHMSRIFGNNGGRTSSKVWQRREASWRGMRIVHYENVGPIVVDITVVASLDPLHKHQRKIQLFYTELRKFGEENTLGDLYDAAMEIDRRDAMAHGLAMAANAKCNRV